MSGTRAAFLGRFQPLHEGHYRVIEEYRERYDDFVLVLGSPEKSRTDENPLSAEEREEIIRGCFPDIDIVRVEDEDRGKAGYPDWAERFVEKSDADVVISGNDLVQRLVEEYTSARVVQQQLHEPDRFSGTEVRRRIREGEPWRELVPDCAAETIAEYADVIRETGDDGDGSGDGGDGRSP